jgi:hypothetical protein
MRAPIVFHVFADLAFAFAQKCVDYLPSIFIDLFMK